jgi:TIR domain
MNKLKYDVALSFSGKDRKYAEELNEKLKERGLKVFYDKDYSHKLMGAELTEVLEKTYRDDCTLCAIFCSENYLETEWGRLEKRAALEKALRKDNHIIPIRIDKTEIPGIRSTIGWIDLNTHTMSEIADLIALKILDNITEINEEIDLSVYDDKPIILGAPSKGLSLPIAHAHLAIASQKTAIKARKIIAKMENTYEFYYTRSLSPFEAIKDKLTDIVKKEGYVGPKYSIQLAIITDDFQLIAHPELGLGASIKGSLPDSVLEYMENHRPQKYGLSKDFFAWFDFIQSKKYPSSTARYSVGLQSLVFENSVTGTDSTSMDESIPYQHPFSVYLFGEAHLRDL